MDDKKLTRGIFFEKPRVPVATAIQQGFLSKNFTDYNRQISLIGMAYGQVVSVLMKAVGDEKVPRYAAIFRDTAGFNWICRNHAEEHVNYLADHSKQIVIVKGLCESREGPPCRKLWVMEVSGRDEAVRLIELDPCFQLGLRASSELLAWRKAPTMAR